MPALLGAGQGMFSLPASRGLPTGCPGKGCGLRGDRTYNGAGVDVVRVAVAVFRLQQDPGVVVCKGPEQSQVCASPHRPGARSGARVPRGCPAGGVPPSAQPFPRSSGGSAPAPHLLPSPSVEENRAVRGPDIMSHLVQPERLLFLYVKFKHHRYLRHLHRVYL